MLFKRKKKTLIKVPVVLEKARFKVFLKDNRVIEFSIEQKLHQDPDDPNIIGTYKISNYTHEYLYFEQCPLISLQISENETLRIRSEEIKEILITKEKLRDDFITKYIYE